MHERPWWVLAMTLCILCGCGGGDADAPTPAMDAGGRDAMALDASPDARLDIGVTVDANVCADADGDGHGALPCARARRAAMRISSALISPCSASCAETNAANASRRRSCSALSRRASLTHALSVLA